MNYITPEGKRIDRIYEVVPCAVGIESISDDGKEVEYDSNGTDLFWDEQRPIKRKGSLVFLDTDGGEWTFDQLIKIGSHEALIIAAAQHGWKKVDSDPENPATGPCLYHEELNRAWPLDDPQGAINNVCGGQEGDHFGPLFHYR